MSGLKKGDKIKVMWQGTLIETEVIGYEGNVLLVK